MTREEDEDVKKDVGRNIFEIFLSWHVTMQIIKYALRMI